MTNTITLNRFTKAGKDATSEERHTAAIWNTDPGSYDATTLLQAWADHEAVLKSKARSFFSFSEWDGSHDLQGFVGATAITLEFPTDHIEQVRTSLDDVPFAYYEMPTRAASTDCTLWAFPVEQALTFKETTRAASLLATMIDLKALMPSSYLFSYFFKFRPGGAVQFRDGKLFTRDFLASAEGIRTDLKAYIL